MVAREVGHLEVEAAGIGKLQLAGLWRPARDDDDTVGTARAVDGRGRAVLEQRDRLHLLGVEVHHAREGDLEAVEDDERCVEVGIGLVLQVGDGGQVGRASELHLRQVVGVGAKLVVHQNVERGVDVGDARQQVLVAILLQLLVADRGHGAGEGLLVFLEDTRHHHLAERAVRLHRHVALQGSRALRQAHGDVFHTHVGESQRACLLANGHGVVAVDIGDGGHLVFYVIDGDADERFALVVDHSAGHQPTFEAAGLLLCRCRLGGGADRAVGQHSKLRQDR